MRVIIIGGGQVGTYIAGLLYENHDVKVIENRPKSIENFKNYNLPEELLVVGDGTDVDVLEKAGIRECDALVCVTGLDEINLTAAMVSKFEYDVPRVIGRVNNPKNVWLFNSGMGIDTKINQADIISGYNIKEGFDRRFDPSTFDNVLTAIGNFLTFRDEKMGEVHQSDYENEKLFIKNGR